MAPSSFLFSLAIASTSGVLTSYGDLDDKYLVNVSATGRSRYPHSYDALYDGIQGFFPTVDVEMPAQFNSYVLIFMESARTRDSVAALDPALCILFAVFLVGAIVGVGISRVRAKVARKVAFVEPQQVVVVTK